MSLARNSQYNPEDQEARQQMSGFSTCRSTGARDFFSYVIPGECSARGGSHLPAPGEYHGVQLLSPVHD